ncbi:hypothetical protein [Paraburkholderia mimosarum]|uniref:hypothetical protein n=1 Tax=Paraburkholderia mimosarum TaxID=312026 RepID=UPI000483CD6D|nr:hypothetical protein [Paraburkholderia mimosarum]
MIDAPGAGALGVGADSVWPFGEAVGRLRLQQQRVAGLDAPVAPSWVRRRDRVLASHAQIASRADWRDAAFR